MSDVVKTIKDGILEQNPVFTQVIGMCPTMAITTSAINGISMGIATTAVLTFSNIFVSALRKFIPDSVRIPIFIVITAAFTTAVEMVLKAFFPEINASLGVYIPLITVNCIILSRSESFACKNNVIISASDGIGMGLGFTIAITLIGALREILGAGAIFGYELAFMPKTIAVILPPGGFITLACIMAAISYTRGRKNNG